MSVAFSSDDSELPNRKIVTSTHETQNEALSVDERYEISRCVDWIKSNEFSKVALQFPDTLLADAASVALKLGQCTDKEFFILGDTTYGSCCVDEIAAEHASADALIHYGHACLSPTLRLPLLYVFGKYTIDVEDAVSALKKLFPDTQSFIVLLYDVNYSYCIESIAGNLKDYENLIISQLDIPTKHSETSHVLEEKDNAICISKCRRCLFIPHLQNLNNYCMFYIGFQNETLTNLMLSFNHCKFYSYDPVKKTAQVETLEVNKILKKRYYYIEKAKDANIIGILIGTLGVSNYLNVIKHLRELISKNGKKSYTLVVGKLNSAKLANFPEIDIFVTVACAESSVIDCHDFYQPIVTPYELEIALNKAREWTGDYITDFSDLLPGAANHIPSVQLEATEVDVSLITGKLRSHGLKRDEDNSCDAPFAVATRDEMKVSTIHANAAGEFLAQRSWKGLEQHLGETPVCDIVQGKKGIASKYEDEDTNS